MFSQVLFYVLIGLSLIVEVPGFSSALFPQSCDSLLPLHDVREGEFIAPQTSEAPYTISYMKGHKKEPITVILASKSITTFTGYILQARQRGTANSSLPIGKFIILDPSTTQLMPCNGSADSTAIQRNSREKTKILVNWVGQETDVIFRATVVQTYSVFWDKVEVDVVDPVTYPKECVMLVSISCMFEATKTLVTVLDSFICFEATTLSVFVLTTVVDLIALILTFKEDSYDVSAAVLTCFTFGCGLLELIFVFLSYRSEELKKTFENILYVLSHMKVILSMTLIYIGVLNIQRCGEICVESWPLCSMDALGPLIPYTILIAYIMILSIYLTCSSIKFNNVTGVIRCITGFVILGIFSLTVVLSVRLFLC